MNEPIEIISSEDERDDGEVIELLSVDDEPFFTSTQKDTAPMKPTPEVLELLSSSPVRSRVPQPPKRPVSTKVLDDILSFGISSDDGDIEIKHHKRAPPAKSDTVDSLKEVAESLASKSNKLLNMPKLFCSDDTFESIVSDSREITTLGPPLRSSPPLKRQRVVPQENHDHEDDDVLISEHNVLLSSSPEPENDKHKEDTFHDSSSIGDIIIKQPKNGGITGRTKPSSSKISLTTSNPFLNSLMKNDLKHQKNIERIRQAKEQSDTQPLRSITDPIITRPENPIGNKPSVRSVESTKVRTSKEVREQIKIQKEKEKRAKKLYQELNKARRTKEELLSEMIIEIPEDVITILQAIDYKEEFIPIQIKETNSSSSSTAQDKCIKWSRKSNSHYDPSSDTFEPADFHLIQESKLCYIYTAREFVDSISTENIVEIHKELKKKASPHYNNVLILIIGLDSYYSKLKNQENRAFQERVRTKLVAEASDSDTPSPSSTNTKTKRKSKKPQEPTTVLSMDEIESTISQLEINGIKVFPTKNVHETIQWLKSFTYTIASARYDKYERNEDLAQIGVIKSGIDPKDTFSKMLQHFKLMTSLKAEKIIDYFPTVFDLYKGINDGDNMIDGNGKKIMSGNIEIGLKKLFTTYDETEILKDT